MTKFLSTRCSKGQNKTLRKSIVNPIVARVNLNNYKNKFILFYLHKKKLYSDYAR